MNLKKILTGEEIVELARLPDFACGQALIKVAKGVIESVRAELESNPSVADGKNDFRYRLGMIEGFKLAEQASLNARQMVKQSEERAVQ